MLRPYNVELDVQVFETLSIVDYGDAPVIPGFIEDSYTAITATLRPLADAGVITLGIGGDHSIALAELRALAAAHGPLALVQFDSHGDVWDSYFGGHKYTHGTPFRRAVEEGLLCPERSVQLGMRGPLYGPEDLQVARDLGFHGADHHAAAGAHADRRSAIWCARMSAIARRFLSSTWTFSTRPTRPVPARPRSAGRQRFRGWPICAPAPACAGSAATWWRCCPRSITRRSPRTSRRRWGMSFCRW